MKRVAVIGAGDEICSVVATRLARRHSVETWAEPLPDAGRFARWLREREIGGAVYLAGSRGGEPGLPDPEDAQAVLAGLDAQAAEWVVLVSSAAVNEPNHHHPGLLCEERSVAPRNGNSIPARWQELEAVARRHHGSEAGSVLTILRPATVPTVGGRDPVSRLLAGGVATTIAGYDPSLQLLGAGDLARAVELAVEGGRGGVYNVAPDGVIPLRRALRLAGSTRLPLPRWLQRLGRALAKPLGVASTDQLEYLRYPWTVSNGKIKRELGFSPRRSSAEVVAALPTAAGVRAAAAGDPEFDDFGMDKGYIASYGRTLFRFLHDLYWRIELDGLEHVPRRGRGMLVGVHRGFMPWDAVMALHALVREIGRYPRFLVHPTLVKFPFLANYITKLGGIHACYENAEWVLQRDELLGVFPEGIRGAFSRYRDAYKLKRFGRDDYVRMALRNRAPIVPYVTLGSAEIFPILGKINWGWWKRFSEWPCFPITPTMGLVPLPSKWHTRFLEPMHVEERYPPEAADDRATVRAISRDVQARMRQAIAELLERRRSIFRGSVFKERPA